MQPSLKAAALIGAALTLALSADPGAADYLKVTRDATIKIAPHGDAEILERPAIGDTIMLINDGDLQNRYYKVFAPQTDRPGWI